MTSSINGADIYAGDPIVLGGIQAGAPITIVTAPTTGGSSSSGPTSFTFTQNTGASVITINHNLGFRPQVTLFNLDYSRQYDEFGVQHLTENALRVSMDQPTPCVVIMS